MKVVVDAFGGDHSPVQIVKGAVMALNRSVELNIVLVGKVDIINKELSKYSYDISRVEVYEANDVISNNEPPVDAIKHKKDSSIVKSFEKLKEDEDTIGFVSAGSTGAVLTGSFLKIGRIKGIRRPALAPLFPTNDGGNVLIIDCGANMDTDEFNLKQFAIMGDAYMRSMFGIEKPRVALLSVGDEDKKGNDLTHKAFALLKEMPNINFVGNMEARYALSGKYDVIVCDGFAGNILTKSIEGTAAMIMGKVKKVIYKNWITKIGGLFLKNSMKELKNSMDYHKYGGAPFLGVKKIVIKSHGSSNDYSIMKSIEQVVELHKKKLIENITEVLSEEIDEQ